MEKKIQSGAAYLNIGCGNHFLSDWENLDFEPKNSSVRKWDIRRGLPCPDEHFDLVYSSHVLEHLSSAEVEKLIQECRRVLRPGGTLRVVVPDLEAMAREYLSAAVAEGEGKKSKKGLESAVCSLRSSDSLRLAWSTLFLIDQLTRTEPGGEMGKMLEAFNGDIPDFIREQLGQDWVDRYMPTRDKRLGERRDFRMSGRIAAGLRWRGRYLRQKTERAFCEMIPGLADFVERWKIAGYLKSGERHQWMYDRYSLAELLLSCGFVNPVILSHTETASGCEEVIKLDADESGRPYRPMSVYAEARADA